MSEAGESAAGRGPDLSPGSKLAVVIMAAGKGTRLKSSRPKVLHQIGGKPLLRHVIAAASRVVAPGDIYVVVGHQAERVKETVASTGVLFGNYSDSEIKIDGEEFTVTRRIRFIEQQEQRGTGHAIQCAGEAIVGYENILVLSGDAPLIQAETLTRLWNFHRAQQAAMTLTSAEPKEPTGYGRIIHPATGSLDVTAIIEQKMLTPEQMLLSEVNMGLYAFRTAPLLAHLDKLTSNNPHSELYLTDMAHVLHAAGERVVAFKTADPDELLGANTIAELVALDATLRAAAASRLMAAGVTIFRPETCMIDAEVEVGPDTVIEPYVQLLGSTRVGSDCLIRSYSVLENCTLGNSVLIRQSCVLAESTVGNGAKIGPFAHLRPGSEIGEEAHVGNFVETKKARLGKGAKANHLTYLGDAEIGERTNIGAGVITCNYDGVQKHTTTIGKDVFVGSDSTLVAPLTVEDGAYIGAGSCITKDVPAGSLALARAEQIVKPGWVAARRSGRKPPQ